MKKALFTLLLLLSYLYSFADSGAYLKENIGEFLADMDAIQSYVEIPSIERKEAIMSPCMIYTEDKNITVSGINEEGLIQIAKLNNIDISELNHFKYTEHASSSGLYSIYLRDKLNEIKSENGIEIDIDFNYLFNVSNKLINERGETIFNLGENYKLQYYCKELFYVVCTTMAWPISYNKVYSLTKILSDYATGIKQTSAKAELQSSKTYDIAGMGVDEDAKGIVIQDGKKVMK